MRTIVLQPGGTPLLELTCSDLKIPFSSIVDALPLRDKDRKNNLTTRQSQLVLVTPTGTIWSLSSNKTLDHFVTNKTITNPNPKSNDILLFVFPKDGISIRERRVMSEAGDIVEDRQSAWIPSPRALQMSFAELRKSRSVSSPFTCLPDSSLVWIHEFSAQQKTILNDSPKSLHHHLSTMITFPTITIRNTSYRTSSARLLRVLFIGFFICVFGSMVMMCLIDPCLIPAYPRCD